MTDDIALPAIPLMLCLFLGGGCRDVGSGDAAPPDRGALAGDAATVDAPAPHADSSAVDGPTLDRHLVDGVPDRRPDQAPPATLRIPKVSDWTDHGVIFSAGPAGSWDHYLYGGFGGTAIKQAGTTFLYYQGAKDYSNRYGTVTFRAIGVATSSDGKSFTKHAGNPVLQWLPSGSLEEGVVSAGATLGDGGEVVIAYGANTAISSSQVNGDGRVASSADGLSFVDQGLVLDHQDASLWGSGDEIFPVLLLHPPGQWLAYYIPNGSAQKGLLGVAWGGGPTVLAASAQVLSQGQPVTAWGMAGTARLSTDSHALFISEVSKKTITAYTMDPLAPGQLSAPVATYAFSNMSQGTVLLDEGAGTWFLYYRDATAASYGVRTAPVSYR